MDRAVAGVGLQDAFEFLGGIRGDLLFADVETTVRGAVGAGRPSVEDFDFLGADGDGRGCPSFVSGLAYSPGDRDDGVGDEYVPVQLEGGGEAGRLRSRVVVFHADQRPHVALLGDFRSTLVMIPAMRMVLLPAAPSSSSTML